jgi:CDP-glucose 4,6-dehydratase
MEGVVNRAPAEECWRGRSVFVTGHTGVKGSYLAKWLHRLGAVVHGYSLGAPTEPALFDQIDVARLLSTDVRGDVRDLAGVQSALQQASPSVVLHLAAQPLVRASYVDPVETYSTNVMGTVNVLEAVRRTASVEVCILVTTDKCYENREWVWGYRESDRLGGRDPYASSKACAELVAHAYRSSFCDSGSPVIATARAGNVVGGGDWGHDRLVPDAVRAFARQETLLVRRPTSTRPWQHALEPLRGYLVLAEACLRGVPNVASAWNFGPAMSEVWPVERVAETLAECWGEGASWEVDHSVPSVHESGLLALDSTKAAAIGWRPAWGAHEALTRSVAWYRAWATGASGVELSALIDNDIDELSRACAAW